MFINSYTKFLEMYRDQGISRQRRIVSQFPDNDRWKLKHDDVSSYFPQTRFLTAHASYNELFLRLGCVFETRRRVDERGWKQAPVTPLVSN